MSQKYLHSNNRLRNLGQVSIEQLKAVHSKTHPAEAPKKAQDNPPENR
jgi:hypothetical protein